MGEDEDGYRVGHGSTLVARLYSDARTRTAGIIPAVALPDKEGAMAVKMRGWGEMRTRPTETRRRREILK